MTSSAVELAQLRYHRDPPLPEVATFDLRAWRTERLGQLKRTPEYKGLTPLERRIVDYSVRAHESPDQGITVSQTKLAKKFGKTREWINKRLSAIVTSGVFIKERRTRADGKRTTNRYRINPVLLSAEDTNHVKSVHTVVHSRYSLESSQEVSLTDLQDEVSFPERQVEAPPTGVHIERDGSVGQVLGGGGLSEIPACSITSITTTSPPPPPPSTSPSRPMKACEVCGERSFRARVLLHEFWQRG
jgi:hypothetical protein